MRTVMEYYQEKVKKICDLRDLAETNRKSLNWDKSMLELEFQGGLKNLVSVYNMNVPKDDSHDGGYIYIYDSNSIFYKVFDSEPVYVVYDSLSNKLEFLKVDRMIVKAPYRSHPKNNGRTKVVNCVCNDIIFSIEGMTSTNINITAAGYQQLAESMVRRFLLQNIYGVGSYITDSKKLRTLVDSNISMFLRIIPSVNTQNYYKELLNMRYKYVDERIPVKDLEDLMDKEITSWISKNKKYMKSVIVSAMNLSDFIRHIYFNKYSGDVECAARSSTLEDFTSVRCFIQLTARWYGVQRQIILKELNRRSDKILEYARLIMYADPNIKKHKKDIRLVNIIINGDNIELVYTRDDVIAPRNDGYDD